MLGNGGATCFWDIAAFSLVRDRAQHLAFGEFSAKFAKVTRTRRSWATPVVIKADPGTLPTRPPRPDVDVYAWAQNETRPA